MNRPLELGVVVALPLALLAGCPSSSTFSPSRDDGAAADAGQGPRSCVAVLGTRPESHACQHTEFGPFVRVVGVPEGVDPPDISRSQRAFVIDTRTGATVSYRPSRDGLHVLLFGPASRVHVLDDRDRKLSLEAVQTEDCAGFDGAHSVELAAGTRYTLVFSAEGIDSITGFVEHLDTFGDDAWKHPCP